MSRTFIHLVETGAARPSLAVLELIARRTGKPVSYFKKPAKRNAASIELSDTLSAAAKDVKRFITRTRLTPSEVEAMRLVESSIRRAARLALSIKS